MGGDDRFAQGTPKGRRALCRRHGLRTCCAPYSYVKNSTGAACEQLKELTADYAFLANTSASNLALLRTCRALGVTTQFMTNIWGYGNNLMKAGGPAGDGVVWVVGATAWPNDAPGTKALREVSRMSDPHGRNYRNVHYVRGVCAMFFMKEAMEWADAHGGISGPNIRRAMYERRDWVPRVLEGVCLPAT